MEDVDQCAKWLHSKHSSAFVDIFGEPEKTTRIGYEYQAQIPASQDTNTDFQNQLKFVLSIPVSWVHDQHKNNEETQANTHESTKCKSGLVPVPGSFGESWSVVEHNSFLLGLYLFGKNLRLVKKFVGNKGLGNVLSHYYGKFYKTEEHQNWSIFRKRTSKRSLPGKKIFTGWRQEELLSRLFSNVTDECKTTLKEASIAFDEGKLSFVKYVFTLRDTVGINLLVESIAIGKENQDLTSLATKGLKNKFHSSLKTEEIVNFLKDGIVLSKARLSELFNEAVWPRLLARGWHSEQPRNYALQNKKHSLVFLAPGVAKFSRRSLEKGSQYFESFTDVLNKVASEPLLLEPEPNQDKLADPQGSNDEQDSMKFTICDTSLVCRHEKPFELRRLVIDLNHSCVGPDLDGDEPLSTKPSVFPETRTEEPVSSGQRQGKRNRALTTKALEALASGFMNPKKKKKGTDDKSPRRVRAKTGSIEYSMVPPT